MFQHDDCIHHRLPDDLFYLLLRDDALAVGSAGNHVGSNKRLMLAHFEQKHRFECEDWAKETLKSMKLGRAKCPSNPKQC